MFTLWNSTSTAEDIVADIYFHGTAVPYRLPVHLAGFASQMLDIGQLVMQQKPDANGMLPPLGATQGSLVFSDSSGSLSPIHLGVSVGVYDVAAATCYYGCVFCDGYWRVIVTPGSLDLIQSAIYGLTAYGTYDDGTDTDVSDSASWSSNSSAVQVNDTGDVTAESAGTATISASAISPAEGNFCAYNPSCEYDQNDTNFTGTASVKTQVPTASRIVSTTQNNGLSKGQPPCAAGYGGWIRIVQKAITDQNGTDVQFGGQSLTETVSITGSNPLGISTVVTGQYTTNAQGQFPDKFYICSSVCPGSTATETASQAFTDSYYGYNFRLATSTISYSCSAIKINGQ